MRKKILSVILTGIMVSVMLSGCGSTTDAGENAAEPAEEQTETEEPEEESEEIVEGEETEPEIITVYLPVKEAGSKEDGSSTGYNEREYDDYGNRIKCTYYNSDGSLDSAEEAEYEYDNVGRVLKKTTYRSNEDGEKYVYGETECEYNKGKLLKSSTTTYEHDEEDIELAGYTHYVYEREYDDKGNIVKTVFTLYLTDGSEEKVEDTYEYDAEGREIKCIMIGSAGWKSIAEYEYDENGSKILDRETTTYKSGIEENYETKWIYEYEYNEAGNIVKKAYFIEGNTSKKFEEEYDANGNMIKHSLILDDDYIDITEYEYIQMQVPDVPKVD